MERINTYFSIFLLIGSTSALFRSNPAQNNSYPFIVSLRHSNGSHAECGTIITKKHVLTFAWTILMHQPKTLEAGSPVLGEGQVYDVEKSLVHPNYTSDTLQHAIGLVWIVKKFDFGPNWTAEVQPAYLSMETVGAGESLVAIGWGDSEDATLPTALREGSFLSLSDVQCKFDMQEAGWGPLYGEHILCATGVVHSEQKWCPFDYGAPLISKLNGYMVGFIHNNRTCQQNPKNVNTATRIQPYIDWIRDVILAEDYDIRISFEQKAHTSGLPLQNVTRSRWLW